MGDLFWPGDERAGDLMSEVAWLAAMVAVEQAWLDTLAMAGIAPASAALTGLVDAADLPALSAAAEAGGNPVLALVTMLRSRAGGPGAPWIHRGLTSQDVVDTGLVLCLRDAAVWARHEVRAQTAALAALTEEHRHTLMTGRTLTQHAVPITFGLKAAGWLDGVLDAAAALYRLTFVAQVGGAAGTLAAVVEIARVADADRPERAALALAAQCAKRLGLALARPWHTRRAAFTMVGDALVGCTDAWGKIATDVVTLSRPEIGELAEPAVAGRGGSSTMPQKRNPILAVLVRRAALAAPPLASTLHLAAAFAEDERPAGGWHAEWSALQALGRRTAVAAAQTTELLTGLQVDADRLAATARAAWPDLTAERDSLAAVTGAAPSGGDYLGTADPHLDAVLARARTWLETHP